MRKIFVTSVLLSLILGLIAPVYSQLADSPWPMFRHDAKHTGRSDYLGPTTPVLKWNYKTVSSITSSPAIGVDGTIYVGSLDTYFYAVNPDGTLKWKFRGGAFNSSPAIGADGTIYVGSDDYNFYAFNPNGTVKWNYTMESFCTSSPVIRGDGTIYVGSYDQYVYAFNPNGTIKWTYWTDGIVLSSPAIGDDGKLYIGSNDNYYYQFASNGDVGPYYYVEGAITSSPAIGTDETQYVGTEGGYLYAFNIYGGPEWMFDATAIFGVKSSPAIATNGTIYIGIDYSIHAVNPDGTQKWKYLTSDSVVSSPAIGADGTIFVGSYDSFLYAINSNGTLKWKFQAGASIESSPAIGSDGTIYFGCHDGNLYAISDINQTPTPTSTPLTPTPTPSMTPTPPPYPIMFNLNIKPDKQAFTNGDTIKLHLDAQTSSPVTIDIYFVLLESKTGYLYFGFDWSRDINPAGKLISLPTGLDIQDLLLYTINLPTSKPPLNQPGNYIFAIGAATPNTANFISNIAIDSFNVQ